MQIFKDVEERIKDLESVNIAFRDKKDFKKLLDNFMSSEDSSFDSLSLNEFRKDFKGIVESLKLSNDFLQIVSETNKEDFLSRQNLEKRIVQLEQGKIENFEERFLKLNASAESNLQTIRDITRSTEMTRKKTENVEKMFKEKCIEIARNGRQQFQQFQALEEGSRKHLEESTRSINQRVKVIEDGLKGVKELSNNEFKVKINEFFEALNIRWNVKNIKNIQLQERQRKALEEERENKRIEDEKTAKWNREKGGCYSGTIQNMVLADKVKYYHKIIVSAWNSWDLNDCLKSIENIQSTNDGKFLFVCM